MKDSEKKTGSSCLYATILLFVVFPVAVVLRAWALSVLWGWFVVGAFNAPALHPASALGLAVLAHAMLPQAETKEDVEEKTPGEKFIVATVKILSTPLVSLLMGWLVHLFAGGPR